jgi:hypothetical protein
MFYPGRIFFPAEVPSCSWFGNKTPAVDAVKYEPEVGPADEIATDVYIRTIFWGVRVEPLPPLTLTRCLRRFRMAYLFNLQARHSIFAPHRDPIMKAHKDCA